MCSLLIVMNTSVIFAVRRSRRMHQSLGGDDIQKKEELRKEISTSVMLVGVGVRTE
jgi:hypothetical protein